MRILYEPARRIASAVELALYDARAIAWPFSFWRTVRITDRIVSKTAAAAVGQVPSTFPRPDRRAYDERSRRVTIIVDENPLDDSSRLRPQITLGSVPLCRRVPGDYYGSRWRSLSRGRHTVARRLCTGRDRRRRNNILCFRNACRSEETLGDGRRSGTTETIRVHVRVERAFATAEAGTVKKKKNCIYNYPRCAS